MESYSATHPNLYFPDFEPLVYEGISLEPFSTKSSTQVFDHSNPFTDSNENANLNNFFAFDESSSSKLDGTFDFLQDSDNLWLTNNNSTTFVPSMEQELNNQPSTLFSIEPELEPKLSNSLERVSSVSNVVHEGHISNTKLQLKGNGDNKGPQGKIIKGQWSEEEDSLLIKLVNGCGDNKKNWTKIAESISGRLGKQCRDRWQNHLRPYIKKCAWSEEEEEHLIELHKNMGCKWSEIARIIKTRSENNIKNHWYATKRKQNSFKDKKNGMSSNNNLLVEYIRSVSSASSQEHQNEAEDILVSNDSTSKELESITMPHEYDANSELDHQDCNKPYIPLGLANDQRDMEEEYHQDPSYLSTPSDFDEQKEMDFFEMLFEDFHY